MLKRCYISITFLLFLSFFGYAFRSHIVDAAEPVLPAGFQIDRSPTGLDPYKLVGMEFMADGSHFNIGKEGRVSYTDKLNNVRFLTINGRANVQNIYDFQDMGFTSFALAKNFATTGKVYTGYTYIGSDAKNYARISEWTIVNPASPTAMNNERVIVDGVSEMFCDEPNTTVRSHGLGQIVVDNNGNLLFSIGDASSFVHASPCALRAQDNVSPFGKLIHIQPDGKGVATNPMYDAANPSSWQSRWMAKGLRNTWSISVDPRNNTVLGGDVGWGTYEEINVIKPGGNYGWPCFEGPTQTPGYKDMQTCKTLYTQPNVVTPAFYSMNRSGRGAAVISCAMYMGTAYPEAYRNKCFFGDYAGAYIKTLELDLFGKVVAGPTDFGNDIGNPVMIRACGSQMCYADFESSTIAKIKYAAGNQAPVARASTTVNVPTKTVSFDGRESYDSDGDQLTFAWDFGDGTTSNLPAPAHAYPGNGPYTATLTVRDTLGASNTVSLRVTPGNNSPVITINAAAGKVYAANEAVQLTATVTDTESGSSLPVTWSTDILHCPYGVCHVHTADSGTTLAAGIAYTKPFEAHGFDSTMRFRAKVTDGSGVTASAEYIANPFLKTVTIKSVLSGQINGVDGLTGQAVVGSTVSVSTPQASTCWTFSKWSDGGAQFHTFKMPASDVTLHSTYDSNIDAKRAQNAFLGDPTGPITNLGAGYVRTYAGGNVYCKEGLGTYVAYGEILRKYLQGGGHITYGYPVTDEHEVAGGRASNFENTNIYWSGATKAHLVLGDIRKKYLALGGPAAYGLPLTDELKTPSGKGQYNDFAGGRSIYWSSATGSKAVYGSIRLKWLALGGENGWMGLPLTDEYAAGQGRANNFQKGNIYWSSATGSHEVHGAILGKYLALGGPVKYGLPTTDELVGSDATGRYSNFTGGRSIYWSPATGPYAVYGAIRSYYSLLGAERSRLRYPTSDEYSVTGGRANNFQGGRIMWRAADGHVTVSYY